MSDTQGATEDRADPILEAGANAQGLVRLRRGLGNDSDRCDLAQSL